MPLPQAKKVMSARRRHHLQITHMMRCLIWCLQVMEWIYDQMQKTLKAGAHPAHT